MSVLDSLTLSSSSSGELPKNRSTDGLLPVDLSASLHTFLVSDPTQSLTFLQDFRGRTGYIYSNLAVLRSKSSGLVFRSDVH